MYIQPNSTIEVMRGVPLTPAYNDTLYFGQLSAQTNWFTNKVVYTFNAQSYQRVNKNVCRVEKNAEDLYACNYMRFKNTAFGSKYFYAFITNVEYVNNAVSEITYEIDIMQTWHFEYQLGKCFVERETSATDQIGDHLLPEPIDPGEPVCYGVTAAGFNETGIALTVVGDQAHGHAMEGLFSGCAMHVEPFTAEGVAQMDYWITHYNADEVVCLYMVPYAFYDAESSGYAPTSISKTVSKPTTIAGFVPNNKKLLTYPYSFLAVDVLNDSQIYKYELFKGSGEVCTFVCKGTVMGAPSVIIVPDDYEVNQTTGYTHQIVMGGYPMCAFAVDTYKQWLAANGTYNMMSMMGSAGTILTSAVAQNYVGMAAGAVGMASAIMHDRVESQKANTARGSVTSNVNVASQTKDVYFKQMGLNAEKAHAVDEFFSRYGYTCERVKVPNRAVRKRWTYTKTKGCVVKGNVPADDLKRIADVFDHGVTFWTSLAEVGEYVFNDNAPGLG